MTFDTTQFVLHNVCRTWTIGNSNTISTKIIQTFLYMMQKKPRHKYLGFLFLKSIEKKYIVYCIEIVTVPRTSKSTFLVIFLV